MAKDFPWISLENHGKPLDPWENPWFFSRSIAVASIHGSNGWEDLGNPWDFPRKVTGIPVGDADGDGLGWRVVGKI